MTEEIGVCMNTQSIVLLLTRERCIHFVTIDRVACVIVFHSKSAVILGEEGSLAEAGAHVLTY